MNFDEFLTFLDWPNAANAQPDREQVERALAEGRDPAEIRDALEEQAGRQAGPPLWHGDLGDPTREWAYRLRHTFGSSSKFGPIETAIALGYQPAEKPWKSNPKADTAEEALALLPLGLSFHGGDPFLDMSNPADVATFDRRMAVAQGHDWPIDPTLFRYLVVTGRIDTEAAKFRPNDSIQYRQVYGLNLQKYLDNEWSMRGRRTWKWTPGGELVGA